MTERSRVSRVVFWAWLSCLLTGGLAFPETGLAPQGRAAIDLHFAAEEYRVGDFVIARVGIRDARNVGSVHFHLLYDQEVLRFVPPAVEGPFLGSDGVTTVFLAADGGGEIIVAMSRLGAVPGISGSGELATFSFEAVAPGVGEFRFTAAGVKSPSAKDLPSKFDGARITIVE